MEKRDAALFNRILVMLAKIQRGDRAPLIRHKDRASAIKTALDDLRRRGARYCRHAGGYGFRWSNGKKIPDEREQATIEAIRQWREAGHTWKDIATHLRRHGILTKEDKLWNVDRVRRAVGARV